MKVISWNVENALRCLPALPTIVEELGRPEVLCLQELRIRERDAAGNQRADSRRCRATTATIRFHAIRATSPSEGDACMAWQLSCKGTGVPRCLSGISKGASSSFVGTALPSSTSMRSTERPSPISMMQVASPATDTS